MVAAFYDQWTPAFLAGCDDVFQSGLPLPPTGPETVEASAAYLAAEARIDPGHRVLDVGCGVGGPARLIARLIPGVVIDGVTISPLQAVTAGRLTAAAGLADRVRVHLADFHAVPFSDAAFDRVIGLEVTGYSPDLGHLYTELRRVLRPGGSIYIKDVFRAGGRLNSDQRRDLAAFDDMWHVVRSPSVDDTVAAMRSAGFVGIESGGYERVGTDRFIGAMVELHAGELRLTQLGKQFFRTFQALPVDFGWVRGWVP